MKKIFYYILTVGLCFVMLSGCNVNNDTISQENSEITNSSEQVNSNDASSKSQSTEKNKTNSKPSQVVTNTECKHSWQSATCTKPQTCSKCGATTGEVLSHSFSKADCKSTEKCTMCGFDSQKKGEHVFENYFCKTCKCVDENAIKIKTPDLPSTYHITTKDKSPIAGEAYHKDEIDYTVLDVDYSVSASGNPEHPFNLFVIVKISGDKRTRQSFDRKDNATKEAWNISGIEFFNDYVRVRHESGNCTSPPLLSDFTVGSNFVDCGTTAEFTYRFNFLSPGENTIEFFRGTKADVYNSSDDTLGDWISGK